MTTTIGIFVFNDVEELDFVGPWEVLRTWQLWWPDDGATVCTVARDDRDITCAKGLKVQADHTWETAPPLDLLIFPGGQGTRAQIGDTAIHGWVRGLAERGALITSVCTGSLVLADAGLLDGRPATTHWASLETLAKLGTDIEVRPEDRYVDSGKVITASGVSAGIDVALHLVVRLQGPDRAREVRRYIQYDPEPPV